MDKFDLLAKSGSKYSLAEVKEWVKKGENSTQEFKLKTHHPEKIVKEIAAFANAHGGRLIIGVADNGKIEGCKFPAEDEYTMVRAIESLILPQVAYQLDFVKTEDEKYILVFDIAESSQKPVYVLVGSEKKVYYRIKDKSIQASKEMRAILKERQKSKAYGFQYGEKEGLLMQYLGKENQISVLDFAELAQIPMKKASSTLVLLTLGGVLDIEPNETMDFFKLKI